MRWHDYQRPDEPAEADEYYPGQELNPLQCMRIAIRWVRACEAEAASSTDPEVQRACTLIAELARQDANLFAEEWRQPRWARARGERDAFTSGGAYRSD